MVGNRFKYPKELEESLPIVFQNASAEIDMIVINRTSLHLSDRLNAELKKLCK
jgi:hypothetical protein